MSEVGVEVLEGVVGELDIGVVWGVGNMGEKNDRSGGKA